MTLACSEEEKGTQSYENRSHDCLDSSVLVCKPLKDEEKLDRFYTLLGIPCMALNRVVSDSTEAIKSE